jgi:hypothetical protein
LVGLPFAFAQQPPSGKSMPPGVLLYRYLDLKQQLLSPSGDRLWGDFQGKLNPVIRLTVISADLSSQPATLRLAPKPDGPAEVTLLLKDPLTFEVVPGMQISFEGIAQELTKEPFQLTLRETSIWLQPVITLSVEPKTIKPGDVAILRWNTKDARDVVLFPQGIELVRSGLQDVSPRQTTTYTMVARGLGGEAEASVVVTVQPDPK